MSRTPVREALRKLQEDGLVEVRPARGTFLKRLSMEEVHEIYEVRIALEGMAACLAAERGATPALEAHAEELRDIQQRAEYTDVRHMQELGWQVHVEMFKAARNAKLVTLYEELRLQIALSMKLVRQHDPDRIRATVAEHLGLADAILRGDAGAAQALVTEHLIAALDARARIYGRVRDYKVLGFANKA